MTESTDQRWPTEPLDVDPFRAPDDPDIEEAIRQEYMSPDEYAEVLKRDLEAEKEIYDFEPDEMPEGGLQNFLVADGALEPQPLVLTAAATHTGIIFCLEPTREQAEAISITDDVVSESAIEPDDVHLTLAYLGSNEDGAHFSSIAHRVGAEIARSFPPMEGRIQTLTHFELADDPEQIPCIAIPDVIGVNELRAKLVELLAQYGVELASEHGFVPHLTLDYHAPDECQASQKLVGQLVSFGSLVLRWGTNSEGSFRTEFPLSGPRDSDTVTAAPVAPVPRFPRRRGFGLSGRRPSLRPGRAVRRQRGQGFVGWEERLHPRGPGGRFRDTPDLTEMQLSAPRRRGGDPIPEISDGMRSMASRDLFEPARLRQDAGSTTRDSAVADEIATEFEAHIQRSLAGQDERSDEFLRRYDRNRAEGFPPYRAFNRTEAEMETRALTEFGARPSRDIQAERRQVQESWLEYYDRAFQDSIANANRAAEQSERFHNAYLNEQRGNENAERWMRSYDSGRFQGLSPVDAWSEADFAIPSRTGIFEPPGAQRPVIQPSAPPTTRWATDDPMEAHRLQEDYRQHWAQQGRSQEWLDSQIPQYGWELENSVREARDGDMPNRAFVLTYDEARARGSSPREAWQEANNRYAYIDEDEFELVSNDWERRERGLDDSGHRVNDALTDREASEVEDIYQGYLERNENSLSPVVRRSASELARENADAYATMVRNPRGDEGYNADFVDEFRRQRADGLPVNEAWEAADRYAQLQVSERDRMVTVSHESVRDVFGQPATDAMGRPTGEFDELREELTRRTGRGAPLEVLAEVPEDIEASNDDFELERLRAAWERAYREANFDNPQDAAIDRAAEFEMTRRAAERDDEDASAWLDVYNRQRAFRDATPRQAWTAADQGDYEGDLERTQLATAWANRRDAAHVERLRVADRRPTPSAVPRTPERSRAAPIPTGPGVPTGLEQTRPTAGHPWGRDIRERQAAEERQIDLDQAKREWTEIYEGRFPHPDGGEFITSVSNFQSRSGSYAVSGSVVFRNDAGEVWHAGNFERVVWLDDEGNPDWVYHSIFELEPQYQNKGFGMQYTRYVESGYRSMGIREIRLEATLAQGGYVWARAGYTWEEDDEDLNGGLPYELRALMTQDADRLRRGGDEELAREIRALLRRSDRVEPIEVTELGRSLPYQEAGKTTWYGKYRMQNFKWNGRKRLR